MKAVKSLYGDSRILFFWYFRSFTFPVTKCAETIRHFPAPISYNKNNSADDNNNNTGTKILLVNFQYICVYFLAA